MASTYLTRTFAQAGNRKTFTISYWIKMGYVSTTADGGLFHAALDGSNSDDLYIHTGKLNFSGYYGATQYQVRTSAQYRDLSGWYHHVIRFDTTQATASDRLRLYVNGELQTALDNNTYPSQDFQTTYMNTARQHTIASFANGVLPNAAFNGSMSHFHFCDGYSYGADSFGETDANGVWKIKTSPSVTYGTNGFFILKDGNSVTDQSGNGNNWTVGGGTLTNTEDCPSNVFATLNPLSNSGGTFSNGNNSRNGGDDTASTLGVSSGKWYWEVKRTNSTNSFHAGICSTNKGMNGTTNQFLNGDTGSIGGSIYIRQDEIGNLSFSGGAGFSSVSYNSFGAVSISSGDILGFALDLDSATKRLDVYQNGSSIGNMTFNYDELNPIFVFCRMNTGVTADFNFGNGYFGTTPIASAGTNASGIGIFEYDVPTGYTALSTKGLNL